MDSMKDQNRSEQSFCNSNKREASTDSFSEQEKQQLIDFFALLLEWDIEDEEKKE